MSGLIGGSIGFFTIFSSLKGFFVENYIFTILNKS